MSIMKKASELPSLTLKSLIGMDSSDSCVARTLSEALPELMNVLFNARSVSSLDTYDKRIPPGLWAVGSSKSKGTVPDSDHNWAYALLAAVNAGQEQFQFMFAYYGGMAYRTVTSQDVPKRWILFSTEKF